MQCLREPGNKFIKMKKSLLFWILGSLSFLYSNGQEIFPKESHLLRSASTFNLNSETGNVRGYTTTTTKSVTTTTTYRRSDFLYSSNVYDTGHSYRGFLDFGFDFSGTKEYSSNFIIRTTHGYQWSQNFFLGIGAGLDFPMGKADHTPNVPLYGAMRFQANHKHLRFVPMVDLRVGYCFNNLFAEDTQSYQDLIKGGFYCNPAVGFVYVLNSYLGVNFAVGYSFYKFKNDEPINGLWFKNRQGVTLELGLEF